MSNELELVGGSDNPFEDVGLPDADTNNRSSGGEAC